MVTVLIPAAGVGRRMARPDRPAKQFLKLGGVPLLVQTLRVFEYFPEVDAIVVAAPVTSIQEIQLDVEAYGLSKVQAIVEGGASRQESVGYALAVAPPETEIVLVHDAVRPFLSHEELADVIKTARETGVAALAVPVADTLRKSEGEHFGETISRDGLWRMLTPQAAHVDILRQAYRDFGDIEHTDEVALIQRAGMAAHLVRGSTFNFKVTTTDDWQLARALWTFWQNERGF